MPVIINKGTGLAEQIAHEQFNPEEHHIPLNDQEGNAVVAPMADVHNLLSQGYSQPSPEQLKSLLSYAKYSTPMEQAKTVLSGAARANSFGLSGLLEDPEASRARQEVNPGLDTTGEVLGLAGSALTGVGEAEMLGAAGKSVASHVLPVVTKDMIGPASPLLRRAANTAIKQSVEMAMLQGGNEIHKMVVQDPNQSMETALTDIGVASVLGGAFGGIGHAAAEPLWNAVQGSKLSSTLGMIKDKMVGVESARIAKDLAEQSGMSLSPEMQAVLSGEESAVKMGQQLRESGTGSGDAFRKQIDGTYKEASKSTLEALGKSEDDIIRPMSEYQHGERAKSALVSELKGMSDEASSKFEPIQEKFAGVRLHPRQEIPVETPQANPNRLVGEEPPIKSNTVIPGTADRIAEDLGKMALNEGYTLSPSSAPMAEVNRVLKELPKLNTLEDLRRYQSVVGENTNSPELYRVGKMIRGILREHEYSTLESAISKDAPELLAQHAEARTAYKGLMDTIDGLNDRLHVGKYAGPGTFLRNLEEMSPEVVLRRLRGSSDANLLQDLSMKFPQTADRMRAYHVEDLLVGHKDGGLDTKKVLKLVDKMSPEMRNFALPPGAQEKLSAIKQVLDAIPERTNPSGTARTLDTLWKHMPGGIGAMMSMMSGHSGPVGYLLGQASRWVGREAPDMGKLAFLKFLGSDAPVDAVGYKALYNTMSATQKAAQTIDRATKAIFSGSRESVLPGKFIPTESQKRVVDRAFKVAQTNPEDLSQSGEKIGHYLPEHAEALGGVLGRMNQVLSASRPNREPNGVLDPERIPPSSERAKYDRTVSLMQQPLLVLQHIKDGTLTPQDVQQVAYVYPSLHSALSQKLTGHMIDAHSKGEVIPYRTRMALSLFSNTPLDSSLNPGNVLRNQMVGMPAPAPAQQKGSTSKGSPKALKTLASSNATPAQAREAHRTQS